MNGQKVRLTDEMVVFANSWNMVKLDRNNEWLYIPFWFKRTDDPNVVEVYSFDHLPAELVKYEAEQRQKLIDNPDKVRNRIYPLVESDCVPVAPVEKIKRKRI